MNKITFVSPLQDFVFSQIFGEQKNIENTAAFLKTLLDIPKDDYDKLVIDNPVLKKMFKQNKTAVVDLKLHTKSGRIIHIELQVEKKANLRSRILYYAARLIGDQLRWGDDYNKLHQVISIVICNHKLIDEEESYINQYELRNENNKSFTNLLKVIILELPKVPESEDSAVWKWLQFMRSSREEEFEMLKMKYPELEKPVFCARRMSVIEKWRNIQFHKNLWKVDERMLRLQWEMDAREEGLAKGLEEGLVKGLEQGLEQGREEGLEQGLEQGQKERNRAIAKNLLSKGSTPEFVHEITGLDLQTVQELAAKQG